MVKSSICQDNYLFYIHSKHVLHFKKQRRVLLTPIKQNCITCHFLTILLNLSVVKSIPWKLVRTLRPWTSSAISLNLRKDLSASLSLWMSARETSNTLYFSPSEAISEKKKNVISLWQIRIFNWFDKTCLCMV